MSQRVRRGSARGASRRPVHSALQECVETPPNYVLIVAANAAATPTI